MSAQEKKARRGIFEVDHVTPGSRDFRLVASDGRCMMEVKVAAEWAGPDMVVIASLSALLDAKDPEGAA